MNHQIFLIFQELRYWAIIGLNDDEETYFNDVFAVVNVLLPSKDILDKAIELRKQYNMKLGDSIIASTAIIYNLDIYTRNVIDFKKVIGLNCINPIT